MKTASASFLAGMQNRRLLVRGVNWLGDAVMTTPALLRVREACPAARITLLCPTKLADLWRGHPALDDLVGFAPGESIWSVTRRLREGDFDGALVLPNSPRSALEAWLARIPRRAGYARSWRNWLLTQAVAAPVGRIGMRKRSVAEIRQLIAHGQSARVGGSNAAIESSHHQVYDYLYLAGALGAGAEVCAPLLRVSEVEEVQAREKYLSGAGAGFAKPGTIWVGLNPGAEYGPAKRWPLDRYVEVAMGLLRMNPNLGLVVFGGRAEVEMGERLVAAGGARILNLAGKTSLRELMALLKVCSLLITNDTGPMHVASALGTPVVGIFGSTSPELTAPGRPGQFPGRLVRAHAVCSPCFLRECPVDFRCMQAVTVADVLAAARSILDRAGQ